MSVAHRASATTRTASPRAGRLVLGGVEIPHERGPRRATPTPTCSPTRSSTRCSAPPALGDIGAALPRHRRALARTPTRSSCCATVVGAASPSAGCAIDHVDATVMLERPKLGPHREAIRASLAAALGIGAERVNVKATTGEGMGFVGRGEGVAALAVATLARD